MKRRVISGFCGEKLLRLTKDKFRVIHSIVIVYNECGRMCLHNFVFKIPTKDENNPLHFVLLFND
jgi:hypothetical protein